MAKVDEKALKDEQKKADEKAAANTQEKHADRLPKPGQKLKVAEDKVLEDKKAGEKKRIPAASDAHDRTEVVPGIHAGKTAKFGR